MSAPHLTYGDVFPDPSTLLPYQLRRRHDGGVLSAHCCLPSAREAFEDLDLAAMMGPTPPGPLEIAWTDLVDTANGTTIAWASGEVPPDGAAPTTVTSRP